MGTCAGHERHPEHTDPLKRAQEERQQRLDNANEQWFNEHARPQKQQIVSFNDGNTDVDSANELSSISTVGNSSSSTEPGVFEHIWDMLQEPVLEILGFEIQWIHVIVFIVMLIVMCIAVHIICARHRARAKKAVELQTEETSNTSASEPPVADMV